MSHQGNYVQPGRWEWVASIVVVAYFSLLVIPMASSDLRGTYLFFVYVLSVPVVVLILLGLGVWGEMTFEMTFGVRREY